MFKKVEKLFPEASKGLKLNELAGAASLLEKLEPSFRYDQNGSRVTLRWSMESVPVQVPAGAAPERIMARILTLVELGDITIEALQGLEVDEPEDEELEVDETDESGEVEASIAPESAEEKVAPKKGKDEPDPDKPEIEPTPTEEKEPIEIPTPPAADEINPDENAADIVEASLESEEEEPSEE